MFFVHLSLKCPTRALLGQGTLDIVCNGFDNRLFVKEMDFSFCRMNVRVNIFRVKKQAATVRRGR